MVSFNMSSWTDEIKEMVEKLIFIEENKHKLKQREEIQNNLIEKASKKIETILSTIFLVLFNIHSKMDTVSTQSSRGHRPWRTR